MFIFTKNVFKFINPENKQEVVVTKVKDVTEVPNWVSKTTIFKLGQKDGSIKVTEKTKAPPPPDDDPNAKKSGGDN